jgi:hypothetical protein
VRLRVEPPANDGGSLATRLDELEKEQDSHVLATELRAVVRKLRSELAREDGPDGFFESILTAEPRLVGRVRRVRQQRAALKVEARRLERYAAAHAPIVFTRNAIDGLRYQWSVHLALERALMQEALLTDVGAID